MVYAEGGSAALRPRDLGDWIRCLQLSPARKNFRPVQTRSSPLTVEEDGDHLAMDLPLILAKPCAAPTDLLAGLNLAPRLVLESGETAAGRNYFAVYDNEEEVRDVKADLPRLEKLHPARVCITALGRESDFVSRYFAPSCGIPEDPVTGSTHCTLAPYWSERLGKKVLHARQVSQRGGDLIVEPRGERVILKGKAVLYFKGEISV